MSDDFSWAPFGSPDQKEPLPPLPPLPARDDDDDAPLPPVASLPNVDDLMAEPPPASEPPPAQTFDVSDVGALAQQASASVTRELHEVIDAPGAKLAGQSLLWGILGVTACPFLIPSIMAVVYGRQAKRAASGLTGAPSSRGSWGIALGWIGIAFWTLAIIFAIAGALST